MSGFFFFLKEKQITQSGKEAEASTGVERKTKGKRVRRKKEMRRKKKATMALIVMVHPTR